MDMRFAPPRTSRMNAVEGCFPMLSRQRLEAVFDPLDECIAAIKGCIEFRNSSDVPWFRCKRSPVDPVEVWNRGHRKLDEMVSARESPDGQTLNPRFGDIEGVFCIDLSAQREQCLEAVRRKIAPCHQSVNFDSSTRNELHVPCLAIFEQQARTCIGH